MVLDNLNNLKDICLTVGLGGCIEWNRVHPCATPDTTGADSEVTLSLSVSRVLEIEIEGMIWVFLLIISSHAHIASCI